MNKIQLVVDADSQGVRIDKFIVSKNDDLSRSYIQTLMARGDISLNNEDVKSNYKVKENDIIDITVEDPSDMEVTPWEKEIDVRFEDSDVIVINKERGMIVHPAKGNQKETLVNALLFHCKDLSGINGVLRPGIVHRIDKDTTGLLIVAKNDNAHTHLAEQLKSKSMQRYYYALVEGVMEHDKGTIDAPIGRDPKDRKKMCVINKNSKVAKTNFTVIERFSNYTLIECKLDTGRTHQIRVHMQFIKHPVVADETYGFRKTMKLNGQLLHAHTLCFVHPTTGKEVTVKAGFPKDFEDVLKELRAKQANL